MRSVALLAIAFYQRHLSPHKGFSCAYGVHTGCASCSVLGYRAIRRYGVWKGCGVLSQRMERCGIAHRRHHRWAPAGLRAQQGFADCSCDLPDLDCASGACDALSACDIADGCSCDLPGRSKRAPEHEASVHLPQRSRLRRTAGLTG